MISNLNREDGANLVDLYPDDAIVTVTLRSRLAGDETFSEQTFRAVRQRLDKDLAEASGVMVGSIGVVWLLFAATASPTPKQYDQLVDNTGVTWQVKQVDLMYFSTVYHLVCVQSV